MAGKEGPLKRCVAKNMAADDGVVAGQVGHLLKPCAHKRKSAAAAGPQITLEGCNVKRLPVEGLALGCFEGGSASGTAEVASFVEEDERRADETAADCGAKQEGLEASEKKVWRLPQAEVDSILAEEFRPPRDFEDLKRRNPSLTPPVDEEMDESTKLLYDAARIFFTGQETFFKFQDQVRQQFKEKGVVDLDHDYLATKAYNRALIQETFEEVCGHHFRDDKPGSTMEA